MVKILREADAAPVADVAKKHGISDVTIYAWRKRFGQLEPVGVKRLRQLEQENAKLKKLVAERDLEIDLMKEVAAKMVGAPVRRRQVAYLHQRGLSLRQACALMSVARSTLRYRSRLIERDAPRGRGNARARREKLGVYQLDLDIVPVRSRKLPVCRHERRFKHLGQGNIYCIVSA